MDRPQRILLFGTSCNPPTGSDGHQGLVRWAAGAKRLECFAAPPDEVWVLPVFRHAYEEKRDMPAFTHRFAMARLAFEKLSDRAVVRVVDHERSLAEQWEPKHQGERLGTIDLIRHLDAARTQPTEWALLLGADTYLDLMADRWKESQKLRSRVGLVVVARKGEARVGDALEPTAPELGVVSSSALRASRDPARWARGLDPDVWAYIQQHELYGFGDDSAEAR